MGGLDFGCWVLGWVRREGLWFDGGVVMGLEGWMGSLGIRCWVGGGEGLRGTFYVVYSQTLMLGSRMLRSEGSVAD